MADEPGQRGMISARDALRELDKAIGAGDLTRAQAMVWRLFAAGVTELTALEQLADQLLGSGHLDVGACFARIASVIAPHRNRSYLARVRFTAEARCGPIHRLATWAFACDPDNAEAARHAGALARNAGQPARALNYLARSLELSPVSAFTWISVGVLRGQMDDLVAARRDLARAVCLAPSVDDAWFALGNVATRQRDRRWAEKCYHRAIVTSPGNAAARHNLGHARRRRDEITGAVREFRRSLMLDPGQPALLTSLGQVVLTNRSMIAVKKFFAWAKAADPNYPEAQFFSGLTDLRTGNFEAGWVGYLWHMKLGFPKIQQRQRLPRWPEEEVRPTGVLVWNDQVGIGEEVMYLGALGQLAERVPLWAMQCSAKLEPLARRSFPKLAVATAGAVLDPKAGLGSRAAEVPLISAVAAMRRHFDDFPDHRGYLVADPERVAMLRRRYAGNAGQPLIGISWASPRGFQGPDKSVPLADWGPVFRALDARFVSLQYEVDEEEIAEARRRHGVEILVDHDLDSFADLDGHAAQIAAMDRVLSISNIAAHLAGALGRPVDMIYPSEIALLWYWFHGRTDSPWYPSMTIHRPPPAGGRAALMRALADHLCGQI